MGSREGRKQEDGFRAQAQGATDKAVSAMSTEFKVRLRDSERLDLVEQQEKVSFSELLTHIQRSPQASTGRSKEYCSFDSLGPREYGSS